MCPLEMWWKTREKFSSEGSLESAGKEKKGESWMLRREVVNAVVTRVSAASEIGKWDESGTARRIKPQ